MAKAEQILEIEQHGEVVFVTPIADLRELDYQQIEAAAEQVLKLLEQNDARHVIMDFHKTDYYGSTALAFFVNVWKTVRRHGGHMAFCGVSQHERQILTLTRLDTLWSICDTREEALDAVQG
jgi:anti-sigma B factor antagonist